MDLSKLPRMSKTPGQEPPGQADTPPQDDGPTVYAQSGEARPTPVVVEAGTGAEAWISAIVGLLFLWFGSRFGGWLLATLSGRVYNHGVHAGDPATTPLVDYWDVKLFSPLSDLALFAFGVALLLEAALLLATGRASLKVQRAAAGAALVVTALAVLLNLATVVKFFADGLGPAIASILAVAFGGWMCAQLYSIWSALGQLQRR